MSRVDYSFRLETTSWKSRDLIRRIRVFIVGLALAMLIPLLRYHHSHLWEEEEKRRNPNDPVSKEEERRRDAADRWRHYWVRGYLCCYLASILCFIAGAASIVWKVTHLMS